MPNCRDCSGEIKWVNSPTGPKPMHPTISGQPHACPEEIRVERRQISERLQAHDLNKWSNRELAKYSLKALKDTLEVMDANSPSKTVVTPAADKKAEKKKLDAFSQKLADIMGRLGEGEHGHRNLPLSVAAFEADTFANQWWWGFAGSGKTYMGQQVAKLLRDSVGCVGYECISMSAGYTLESFVGYSNIINGGWIPGEFQRRLDAHKSEVSENVFKVARVLIMFDECDRLDPGLAVWLNATLEQRMAVIGGAIYDLKSVLFVATGNSSGVPDGGAYTAVQQQDAAFLSRFPVKLKHDYDEEHELKITPDESFTKFVQRVRRVAVELHMEVASLTPRVSLRGGELVKNGMPRPLVEEITVWNAIPNDLVPTLKDRIK